MMPSESTDYRDAIFKFLAWRFLTSVFIAIVIAALWFAVSPILAIFSPIVIIILFPELAGMTTSVRRQRGAVILSYLEQAVRLNLPLAGMLRAARQSESGETANRLFRLETRLEDGASLASALRQTAPEVGPRAIGLIGSAERTGRLAQALARLTEEQVETPEQIERGNFGRWYPLLMTLTLLGVTSIILIFVVPKLEYIYHDFGVRLPSQTRVIISISRSLFHGTVPMLLIVVIAAYIITLGGMFERIFAIPPTLPRLGWLDAIVWHLPVLHGVARDRGLADACDTIAGALRAGQPLTRAIEEATTLRINAVLRRRLRAWQLGIESGSNIDDAARSARLPALFCGMVGAGRGTDPVQALEFLESYYGGRFSRTREFLRAGAVPAMTLCFGAIVLFVAMGMFSPLLEMMGWDWVPL